MKWWHEDQCKNSTSWAPCSLGAGHSAGMPGDTVGGGCTMVLWALLVLSTTFLFIKTTKKRQKHFLIDVKQVIQWSFWNLLCFFGWQDSRWKLKQLCLSCEFYSGYFGRLCLILFTYFIIIHLILFYSLAKMKKKNPKNLHSYWWCYFISTNRASAIFSTGSAEPAISWLGFCNSIFLQAWKIHVLWFLATGWLLFWIARCC